MTSPPSTVKDLLADIETAPPGPRTGAFFDFDGTLIDGYSAAAFYEDRLRRFDMSRRSWPDRSPPECRWRCEDWPA